MKNASKFVEKGDLQKLAFGANIISKFYKKIV